MASGPAYGRSSALLNQLKKDGKVVVIRTVLPTMPYHGKVTQVFDDCLEMLREDDQPPMKVIIYLQAIVSIEM